MNFHNFKVTIDKPAKDITIKLEDDFAHAEWVLISELSKRSYSPSVEGLLKTLGLI
jgi:hypothetical protein